MAQAERNIKTSIIATKPVLKQNVQFLISIAPFFLDKTWDLKQKSIIPKRLFRFHR